jgi:hypothetical protein
MPSLPNAILEKVSEKVKSFCEKYVCAGWKGKTGINTIVTVHIQQPFVQWIRKI